MWTTLFQIKKKKSKSDSSSVHSSPLCLLTVVQATANPQETHWATTHDPNEPDQSMHVCVFAI